MGDKEKEKCRTVCRKDGKKVDLCAQGDKLVEKVVGECK
jgi:hypothetical protein